jgi:hypothetical protein
MDAHLHVLALQPALRQPPAAASPAHREEWARARQAKLLHMQGRLEEATQVQRRWKLGCWLPSARLSTMRVFHQSMNAFLQRALGRAAGSGCSTLVDTGELASMPLLSWIAQLSCPCMVRGAAVTPGATAVQMCALRASAHCSPCGAPPRLCPVRRDRAPPQRVPRLPRLRDCSEECQVQHWKPGGHRKQCAQLAARRTEE